MDEAIVNLQHIIENLAVEYDSLSQVMHLEREFLISSDIEQLQSSQNLKESILNKIKQLESNRQAAALQLADFIDLKERPPRLLQIVAGLQTLKKKKEASLFLGFHQSLEAQLKKVAEQNRENEIYASSALRILGGAIGEIKNTLGGKKTYQRKGQLQGERQANSGNLVSREV